MKAKRISAWIIAVSLCITNSGLVYAAENTGMEESTIQAVHSLRVDDDRIDQLEDVLLAADVAERVVVHGFTEIDGVQRLDDVASLFKHFAALHQHRSFRVGDNV